MAQIKYNLGNLGTDKYSTDEIKIGEWINGKPLYRKTFNIPTITNGFSMPISELNHDTIVDIRGFGFNSDDNNRIQLYYVDVSFRFICYTNTNKQIVFTTSRDILNSYITIEYTKTTDA